MSTLAVDLRSVQKASSLRMSISSSVSIFTLFVRQQKGFEPLKTCSLGYPVPRGVTAERSDHCWILVLN